MTLVAEAVASGAREAKASEVLGLSVRTLERWRKSTCGEDQRRGPKEKPSNVFSPDEQTEVLKLLHSKEFRNLAVGQVVVRLADNGLYVASESTMYRLLREENEVARRDGMRPAVSRTPRRHVATGPNQVWCWDITLLPTPWRGRFFYMYTVIDLFSRRIMGIQVLERESAKDAAALIQRICDETGVDSTKLVLHSDNGPSMKGGTMLDTLRRLRITASFSRPYVSDDNAYVESFFRTLKYGPGYPGRFDTVELASTWAHNFVNWYNHEHRHSGIRWVTPEQRYTGADIAILAARKQTYERARRLHPRRWIGPTRNWERPSEVLLNHSQPNAAKA